MKPIPQGEGIINDALKADKLLQSVMNPATREQIAMAIKKLSLHCGKQFKNPDDIKHMFNDYCEDLAEYPALLINQACKSYRTQAEGNNFMPSSGKLIELMSKRMHSLRKIKSRVDKILGVQPVANEKPVSLNEAIERMM